MKSKKYEDIKILEVDNLSLNADEIVVKISYKGSIYRGCLSDLSVYGEEEEKIIRKCSHCNKIMTKEYCINGGEEYFCSDSCLHTKYSPDEWKEMYHDDGDSYWTEWEDE